MTYHEVCAALRTVLETAPGRVLALKVTPEQCAVLCAGRFVGPAPTFRGIPLVMRDA